MLTGKNRLPFGALPPDRRKGGFSSARAVGSFVPKLAEKAFERHGFHSAEILTEWPRIAGKDFAAWTSPERIRWPRGPGADGDDGEGRPGASLTLRVEPARALDVEYRSAEIIDRINRYFGYRAVQSLRLIQAPLAERTGPSPAVAKAEKSPDAEEPLPGGGGLSPDLRAALTGLWQNLIRR